MKKLLLILLVFVLGNCSYCQFKDYKVKGGAHFHGVSPSGELKRDFTSFLARGFFAVEAGKYFDIEVGGGFLKWKQKDHINTDEEKVEADIVPLDLRIRFEPVGKYMKYANPYLYVGGGVLRHKLKKTPVTNTYVAPYDSTELEGWVGFFPAGIGVEVKLAKQVLLDFTVGMAYTLSDKINNMIIGSPYDGWFNYGLGLVITGRSGRDDTDRDGLYDDQEEEKYLTDPENPDTDGDGLRDGEEVKTYKTDPKNPDTDGDGLTDSDEVKNYLTLPTNPDSDNDGLKDGQEVSSYATNPNLADTDGDDLGDGEEVNNYKTDPLKADSDGDSLNDGDELKRYGTNPLKADTDGGTVDDGTEVRRGTNPLFADDDIEKEEIKVGETVILEGINFETGSARITFESESVLMKAYNTMANNPKIEVEISGHTDSRGSNSSNQRLSEDRANSVKFWLVAKGIDGSRITTVGYGEDRPIAPNDSPENMLKNRRIEFKRIK
jgi:outer membrane protein OmpA-like peptidoglycan-associated protein